jgi:glycosidase
MPPIRMPRIYFTDVGTKNDVMACRKQGYDEEQILSYLASVLRVNARTPMQWDRSDNAGFTSAKPGVNAVNPNYLERRQCPR